MTIIDNFELDTDNKDFNYAVELVKNGNKLIYLTGKAGTGKTTFLKYIKSLLGENIVVLAPTGVAAINAGGQTIHSFFKVSPSVYVPNDKRLRVKSEINDTDKSTIYDHFKLDKEKVQLINKMEILIIDEISMVRCDLLDVIDKLLRVYRKKPNEIFGGLQIILIGDTFQLPPIADYEQWEILRMFYASPYFFSSQVITNNKPIFIELKKIYRQKEQEFIDLLNKIRVNQMDSEDLQKLNQRYNPNVDFSDKLNQIILATTNKIVNDTNQKKLTELAGEQKSFEASVEGIFPESIYPTEKTLSLKVGAQIMFIKNDFSKNIFNGKLGKVKSFSENRIVVTGFDNFNEFEISVETNTWKNIRYKWDDTERKIIEEIIGTFTQIPLKLAWAITVHKSQGLTFDNVIADLSGAFATGQVYVALSRCKTLNGLVLKSIIPPSAIKTDEKVIEFAENETPDTLIIQEISKGKADFYYKNARTNIAHCDFAGAYENFLNAIKHRNDIETDIFKRYFIAFGTKFSSYKKQILNANEAVSNLLESQGKLSSELNKTNEVLKNQSQNIVAQKNKIEELNLKFNTLNFQNTINVKKIESHIKENNILNEELNLNMEIISQQESKITHLRELLKIYDEKNEKLRNLKWYHLLFNSK